MLVAKPVQPLPWYGGKARGRGQWIASLLPWDYESLYCEPCCGMANVWAARAPVKVEILNDLNDRIINWWRVARDHADEFGVLIESTPRSRREHQWGLEHLDDADPVRRALAFHVVVEQGVINSDVKTGWAAAYTLKIGSRGLWKYERVAALAKRLRSVELECKDAIALLEKLSSLDYAVVYVDPPYETAETSAYLHESIETRRLGEALMVQKGRVAISGYADEWNFLGWQRHEKEVAWRGINRADGTLHAPPGARTEVLWTNYQPSSGQLEMFA